MNLLNHTRYSDPTQEKHIQNFQIEINSTAQVEGKHSGSQNKPTTEAEYRAVIMNQVETKTQIEIDRNHHINTPVSGMVLANRIISEAKEKIKSLNASLAEDELKLKILEHQKKQCQQDVSKRRLRLWVNVGIAVMSVTEGYFAYEALRAAPLGMAPAICFAIGIAVAIGFGSHFLGGYIQKAKTKLERRIRYLSVLIPSFIGFYFLGHIRAHAYNQTIDLHSQLKGVHEQTSHISGWSITILSFLLFLVALIFSVLFYKTDEEKKQDQEHDRLGGEINEIKNKMKATQNKISEIQKDANEKAAEALARYEFALGIQNRLQAIARHALEVFNSANLKYRTDGLVPVFFSYPPAFKFRLFFNNINTTPNEKNTSIPAA